MVLISSELEEVVEGADRVLVLRDGAVVGALRGDEISEHRIMTHDRGAARDARAARPPSHRPRWRATDRLPVGPWRATAATRAGSVASAAPDHGRLRRDRPCCWSSTCSSRRNFATVANLRLQLVQVVPVAIVALGMALVIATEGIDLSVGSVMAISRRAAPAVPRLRRLAGDRRSALLAGAAGRRWSTARWSRSSASSRSSPRSACWWPAAALALVLADGRLVEIFDPTLGALGNGTVARRPDHAC